MPEQTHSWRMQKGLAWLRGEGPFRNRVQGIGFSSMGGFLGEIQAYLDLSLGSDWLSQLKEQVEKASYAVGVLPNNAVATEEVVQSLGFLSNQTEPDIGEQV